MATNTDLTLPTDDGLAPGHGAAGRRLISDFAERDAAGGRQAASGRCSTRRVRRVGGERPLMVGDRLDTDIEGAHEAEVDSLLVMTGVSGLRRPGGRGARASARPSSART